MELRTIFGLPAHILIVHAAVVFVPLTAIVVIVICSVPRWRSSHALLGVLFSAGAVTSVALASQTGESLQDSVKRNWTSRSCRCIATLSHSGMVLVVGAIFFGLTSTYFVTQAGHSGAKATWSTVKIDGK